MTFKCKLTWQICCYSSHKSIPFPPIDPLFFFFWVHTCQRIPEISSPYILLLILLFVLSFCLFIFGVLDEDQFHNPPWPPSNQHPLISTYLPTHTYKLSTLNSLYPFQPWTRVFGFTLDRSPIPLLLYPKRALTTEL